MWKYALFHSNKDVGILAECPIDSNKVFREDSGMVYFSMISISGLANRHLEGNVYFKSNDIFKAGGNLGNLIVKTVYGGRCMVGDSSMSKINNEVVNSNAVSLHPSAVKRAHTLEGKPVSAIAAGVPLSETSTIDILSQWISSYKEASRSVASQREALLENIEVCKG